MSLTVDAPPSRDLSAALAPLTRRRSALEIGEPGPTEAELAQVLGAACTVPDHGLLRPYRFVVVRGAGRDRLADALAAAHRQADPEAPETALAKTRAKTTLAPVMVVLVASPRADHKVPVWEQVVTASCAGYGLVLAADLAGFGAVWKTAGVLQGAALDALLDLRSGEQVLGWVNVGARATVDPAPRAPVDLAPLVTTLAD